MKDLLFWEEEESFRELPEDPDWDIAGEAPTRAQLRRERLEATARKEMAWFFGTLGGRVPEEGSAWAHARLAAQTIDGWLKALAAFHRGALSLRYTPKTWPPALTKRYREWTSLVVRLECAIHHRVGVDTEAAERAAVERLEDALRERGGDGQNLGGRAEAHEHLGIHAYLKVRGDRACVIPRVAAARKVSVPNDCAVDEPVPPAAETTESPPTQDAATSIATPTASGDEGAAS